jgi:PilZ domain-containing protein
MDCKRKYDRFCCQGSAELTDDAHGRVWGHLGDISLGGFYLSTFGPWAVNREVRFKLDVEGREIFGVGVVATSHPGVGMAVTIQELSGPYRDALQEVIRELRTSNDTSVVVGLLV